MFFSLFFFAAAAQPYDVAPRTSKKIQRIIEWESSRIGGTATKGMVSTFDRSGNLVAYTSDEEYQMMNTRYLRDPQGRPREVLEGKGSNRIKTSYTYKADRIIIDEIFRGKYNRIIQFVNKKGRIIEQKSYAKGLELGDRFRLREQIFFSYDRAGRLLKEQYRTYSIPNNRPYMSRKKVYQYHSKHKQLLKTIDYDYDGSISQIEDYLYYADGQLRSVLTHSVKEDTHRVRELKYKNGSLWQRLTSEKGLRHVEVFVDGRLIRLRSYNGEQLYRVVDYQYEYYP